MPGEAFDVIQNQIVTVLDAPNQALGLGIIISLAVAIFSAGAGIRAMMRAMNIAYEEIDVSTDRELQLEVVRRSGRQTVPQIFFGDEHIGGYDDLVSRLNPAAA